MTKPHCLNSESTYLDLKTIIKGYKDSYLRAHGQVKEDDWKAFNDTVNDGFGTIGAVIPNISVDRPPDGPDFFKSDFYVNIIAQISPFLNIGSFNETTLLSEYNLMLNTTDPSMVARIEQLNITRTLASSGPLTVATDIDDIPVDDLRDVGRLWTAGSKLYNFAQQLSSPTVRVCPDNLDEFTMQTYLQAMKIEFKAQTAGVAAGAAGGAAAVAGAVTTILTGGNIFKGLGIAATTKTLLDALFDDAVKAIEDLLDVEGESVFAEQQLYREQCFVLSQISDLVEIKQGQRSTRLPYQMGKKILKDDVGVLAAKTEEEMYEDSLSGNAPLLMRGDPFAFMNKLIQYPTTNSLFNLTNAQISSLVPTIRLYRVNTDPNTGDDIGEVEIQFDTNPAVYSYRSTVNGQDSQIASALDLFKNKKKRGYGVGLKNFDFTFHGSDPFAVKKAIEAKLTIFATSFGDLIQEREGYKYADLALKTGNSPSDIKKKLLKIQQQNLDKLNFRLKAIVGWAIPNKDVGDFDKSEIDAVRDSFATLNLTPTIHDFSFDEMGGVTFTINYLAYIEDYFNQSTFNIFSDPEIEAARISRRLFFEYLNTQKCDEASVEMIKEASAKILLAEKSKSFASILKTLRKNEKIYNYNVSFDDLGKFLQTGKFSKKPSLVTNDDASSGAIVTAYKTFAKAKAGDVNDARQRIIELTKTSKEQNIISFFFISDLLDVIMDNIDRTLVCTKFLTPQLPDKHKQFIELF